MSMLFEGFTKVKRVDGIDIASTLFVRALRITGSTPGCSVFT